MASPARPAESFSRSAFRLASGLELLEEWSRRATQVEKNVVDEVLFAIVGRSVFTDYDVVDDVRKTMEFFVLAKCDLTVKIRVHSLESFGIGYVGPTCEAPGLDPAAPDPDWMAFDPEGFAADGYNAPTEDDGPRD